MDQAIHSDPSGLIKDKFNHVLMRTFKLEDLEMIKTIGTGTFARVFLCRPRAHLNRSNTDYYALKVRFKVSFGAFFNGLLLGSGHA